ncbi:hypothetical protein FRC01_012678, partial [Tulasnella sp. 417]
SLEHMTESGTTPRAHAYPTTAQDVETPELALSHDDISAQLGSPTEIDGSRASLESDSSVQPGFLASEDQLPPELSGSLRYIAERVPRWDRTFSDYAKVFEGILEESDGSTRAVAIKCIFSDSYEVHRLCDAARGLTFLHSLDPPIVHGDIKPDNVLVRDNLEAAICDLVSSIIFFGVSKGWTLVCGEPPLYIDDAGYLAPETLREPPSPPVSSDVYAFGGLILAVMSGQGPLWKKRNPGARMVATLMGERPRPTDHLLLPEADPLWCLINACWQEDPEARPPMELVLQT